MGLERVLLALEQEGLAPPEEPGLVAFVVGVGDAGRARARDLVREPARPASPPTPRSRTDP